MVETLSTKHEVRNKSEIQNSKSINAKESVMVVRLRRGYGGQAVVASSRLWSSEARQWSPEERQWSSEACQWSPVVARFVSGIFL
jgi:hypothetical protein